MRMRGIMRRIDPAMDEAIRECQIAFGNRISYREASRILGDNNKILIRKKGKPQVIFDFP